MTAPSYHHPHQLGTTDDQALEDLRARAGRRAVDDVEAALTPGTIGPEPAGVRFARGLAVGLAASLALYATLVLLVAALFAVLA